MQPDRYIAIKTDRKIEKLIVVQFQTHRGSKESYLLGQHVTPRLSSSLLPSSFFFYHFPSLFYTRRRLRVEIAFFFFYCSLFVVVQVSTFLQSCSTTNSVVFVPINSVPLNPLCLDLVLELQQSFLFQSFDKWVWRWVVASFSKMGVEVGSRILQ